MKEIDFSYKILTSLFILIILIFFLIGRILYLIFNPPVYNIHTIITKKESSTRGTIFSKNGLNLAYSQKMYAVAINRKYINETKKEILFSLLSIYLNIPKKYIENKVENSNSIRVVLTKNLSIKEYHNLKYLATVLDIKKVFLVKKNGIRYGLEVYEVNSKRVYTYDNTLEPVLGYLQKSDLKPINGLEKFYDDFLSGKSEGNMTSERDLRNNLIIDGKIKVHQVQNGDNIYLNVDLTIQKKIENILDKYKKDLNATGIMVAVENSKTGEILSIASSNRYIPDHILQSDVKNINIPFVRYLFEPGSVMKPITIGLLLEDGIIDNVNEIYDAHNGRWKPKWRKKAITDDHKAKWLSISDAVVYSSNIVLTQLAIKLSAPQFYNGLKKLGFGKRSGIDLPYELRGRTPTIGQFSSNIYKGTVGYGYGIRVNFMQLLKVYNAINNGGILINPLIANRTDNIKFVSIKKRAFSEKTTFILRKILRKVVLKGTGTAAKIDGIWTAGKTGTAYITKNGEYTKTYNSSFFGFANDKSHRWTIGVTVINPIHKKHFASQSAVPIFKEIVLILQDEGYLK